MPDSLLSRKRDLAYLTYFTIAIPIAFIVDLQPIYPESLIPKWMSAITDFYVNTYHDQFFVKPPPFFLAFIWSEALIQVPSMIWGWNALYKNSPKIPVVLLPFSCLIFVTTATCIVEYMFWPSPLSHKINLTFLYGPYLVLSALMMVDMCVRINGFIDRAQASTIPKAAQKKKQ